LLLDIFHHLVSLLPLIELLLGYVFLIFEYQVISKDIPAENLPLFLLALTLGSLSLLQLHLLANLGTDLFEVSQFLVYRLVLVKVVVEVPQRLVRGACRRGSCRYVFPVLHLIIS
jgi:hypothetical protein